MTKQMLTLDDLFKFFVEQNKSFNFNAKESGSPIVVSTNGMFESNDTEMPGMLGLKLKVCHTETNRNGSHISKENMEKAMPTLKYRPILAYIHELPDGTKDFYSHNVELVEDENGETQVVYIERQVGCFTADEPWLEYDKDKDKTYVQAYAVIPEEYTEAADIIRRKNGTKVSCELVINELSYNAKEKYLDLTDFYFGATTLLGSDENGNEIGEGMLGARADIADFCHKAPVFNYQDKLIETLEKLNVTLAGFNKKSEEGGNEEMDNFEENGVEEVEADDVAVVETAEEEDVVEESTDDVATETDAKKKRKCSVDEDGNMSLHFEISHEDIRCALYNLISTYDEEDNEWYYIRDVYDNYFYMQGWMTGKLYKLGYTVDGDNVALEGDRQEMFEIIVTESEKLAIDKMREDYAALEFKYNELKQFKDNYDSTQLKAEKEAIFDSAEYAEIKDTDEFKALMADMDKYSVEEIKVKADLIFAASMKKKFSFEAQKPARAKSVGINFNAKTDNKKQAYAGLFDD